MPQRQSVQSSEFVAISVAAKVPELSSPDITDDTVWFQFVIGGIPTRSDPVDDGWHAGEWVASGSQLLASILVGPNGLALPKGTYAIWIKVGDHPSVPVAAVDQITIT